MAPDGWTNVTSEHSGTDHASHPSAAGGANPGAIPVGAPAAVEVYWRPGCGFCSRLLRSLEREGVVVTRRNIWDNGEALAFVRAHNRGNETVPTVDLGGAVSTNPSPSELLDEIRTSYPHLIVAADHQPGWRERLGLR